MTKRETGFNQDAFVGQSFPETPEVELVKDVFAAGKSTNDIQGLRVQEERRNQFKDIPKHLDGLSYINAVTTFLCETWPTTTTSRVVPTLVEALRTSNNPSTAAPLLSEIVFEIGPEAREAVSHLVEAICFASVNPESCFRTHVISALGCMGPGAREAVPVIAEFLKNGDSKVVCRYAASALRRIGPDARAAIPILIDALKNNIDTNTRVNVALALGEIGEKTDAVKNALTDALKDDTTTRVNAVLALCKPGDMIHRDEEARAFTVRTVTEQFKDDYHRVRMAALTALYEIDPNTSYA